MNLEKTLDVFQSTAVPAFQHYIRTPKAQSLCKRIDASRIMVEIITGFGDYSDSDFSRKMLIDGQYALVMRYRREKDEKYRPACALSMDFQSNGSVVVRQLQGSNDKNVSYRFASSFDSVAYFADLLEEYFIKNGISVEVLKSPKGLDNAAHNSQAISKYQHLSQRIQVAKDRHLK